MEYISHREDTCVKYRVLSQYRSELMGIAMLWVMLFHAFDLNMGHPALEELRRMGFAGVDMFILLSSMGLAMSLARREQDYTSFMARRAARILPAYYVVMIPYTVFLIVTADKAISSLFFNSTLLYYWARSSGSFNWYIAGAMTFYALTPFCFRRWQRSRNRIALTAVCVVVAFALCELLIFEDYWYYMDVFYRFPVFFMGLLLGFFLLEDRPVGRKDLLFWLFWFALGCAYYPVSRLCQWDAWVIQFPLCLMFVFTTVPLCLFLCFCFEKLPLGLLRKFFRLIGENSLEIYLFNVSFFSQTALIRRFIAFGPSNRLYYLVIYTLNILCGLALHQLVEGLRARYKAAKEKEESLCC